MLNDYFTWNGKKSSDFGIIIKHKFRKFKEKRANKKAGIPDNEGTAAENKEEITKTIQAEERTDSNGQ